VFRDLRTIANHAICAIRYGKFSMGCEMYDGKPLFGVFCGYYDGYNCCLHCGPLWVSVNY